MYEVFSHFTLNEWIYESKMVVELEAAMTPEERKVFYCDPKSFTWQNAVDMYGYGFMKYMQKEDVVNPDGKTTMFINRNHFRYFDNVRRAFVDCEIMTKDPLRIRKDTLLSNHLLEYIDRELKKAPVVGSPPVTKDTILA